MACNEVWDETTISEPRKHVEQQALTFFSGMKRYDTGFKQMARQTAAATVPGDLNWAIKKKEWKKDVGRRSKRQASSGNVTDIYQKRIAEWLASSVLPFGETGAGSGCNSPLLPPKDAGFGWS